MRQVRMPYFFISGADSMAYSFPVFAGDVEAGRLAVSREGLYVRFVLTAKVRPCPARLMCRCGGRDLSIGVPVPKNGVLRLDRRLSAAALGDFDPAAVERAFLAPVVGADDRAPADAPSGWRAVPSARALFPEAPDVPALYDASERPRFALPFVPGKGFAAPWLLPRCEIIRIGDGLFAVFSPGGGCGEGGVSP